MADYDTVSFGFVPTSKIEMNFGSQNAYIYRQPSLYRHLIQQKICYNDNLNVTKPSPKRKRLVTNYTRILYLLLYRNIRGMFEMNCLLSSSSISTWGTIKTNTYLYRAIQYLHNGV